MGKKREKSKKRMEVSFDLGSGCLISHLGRSAETFNGVPRRGWDKDDPCPSQFLILLLVPYNFFIFLILLTYIHTSLKEDAFVFCGTTT